MNLVLDSDKDVRDRDPTLLLGVQTENIDKCLADKLKAKVEHERAVRLRDVSHVEDEAVALEHDKGQTADENGEDLRHRRVHDRDGKELVVLQTFRLGLGGQVGKPAKDDIAFPKRETENCFLQPRGDNGW